jgi:GNAT superfamily N-acetyltransferase
MVGSAEASVRRAVPGDAPRIARVQAAVWARTYAGLLPPDLLAAPGSADAAETWQAAAAQPPSERHRVLTALDGDRVVGVAALAPATDPDLDPQLDAELHVFCVDPDEEGRGHGSRLLNAAADMMREAGVQHLHVWLGDAERPLRTFLEGAGWAVDGATRTLDLRGDGEVQVAQVRMRTAIGDG